MRDRNAKKCQFQVELLEGRIPPSTLGLTIHPGAAQVAPKTVTVQYKETVTLVGTFGEAGTVGLISTYTGYATPHIGHITIVTTIYKINSDGTIDQTFTRVASNGATMFGSTVVTPTGNTTGVTDTLVITVLGGTKQFKGVTGSQTGTVSVNPNTGVTTAVATGTLTFPK